MGFRVVVLLAAMICSLIPLFVKLTANGNGLGSYFTLSPYLPLYQDIILVAIVFVAFSMVQAMELLFMTNPQKDRIWPVLMGVWMAGCLLAMSIGITWYVNQVDFDVSEAISSGDRELLQLLKWRTRAANQFLVAALIANVVLRICIEIKCFNDNNDNDDEE